jgi:ribonuclease-3
VAARLRLGEFLLLGRGEEATGGRTRTLNQARVLEAVIGAVYRDRGFRIVQRWLLKLLAPEFEALGGGDLPEDAKSRLQHTAQMLYSMTPRYRIAGTEGPDHDKIFMVQVTLGERIVGAGRGRSKRIAEREAAEAALATIQKDEG